MDSFGKSIPSEQATHAPANTMAIDNKRMTYVEDSEHTSGGNEEVGSAEADANPA